MSKKKENIFQDHRFSHLLSNPRFKKLSKNETKVKIDERFKSMFEDEKFNKYHVDKYGRKIDRKSAENLKNYYDLSSNESIEEEISDQEEISGNAIIKGGNNLPEKLQNKLKDLEVDYIRGEGILQSDSSDDESSDEEDENGVEHQWGTLDQNAERTEDSTRRIACMHMDWNRIRAVDIMVLCNSFIPAGSGSILSVHIYSSEFGKQRLAEEEIQGPKEIAKCSKIDSKVENTEEDETYFEKLREYQLNRLKYYYAVVEFDSVKCADIVYKECDGLEYESTANRLDLRFIPDDMEFNEDTPKDSCTELPDLLKYEPRIFFTTALQHAKVELTWDETDVSRKEISEKLFSDKRNEVSDKDLRNFVAFESENDSVSEIDEENVSIKSKNKISCYKSLLEEINQKEAEKKKQQVEMEYSWSVGDVKKTLTDDEKLKEELTPFEQILEKKKLKKKLKKEVRRKKNSEIEENGYSSSDFDDIDMNDPYFAEEFESAEFKKPSKKHKSKSVEQDDTEEKMRAQRELELLLDDENEEEKSHFSLKKIQDNEGMSARKKRRLKKLEKSGKQIEKNVDNFELDVEDKRFNAIYTKPEFNIDPTNPFYKKTKAMEKLIGEKLKRRHNTDINQQFEVSKKAKKDMSLNLLVKNIKRKVGKY